MKTPKTNNKKKSQKADSFPHCGDFQRMAEMMKAFCSGEGDAIDCCSFMRRMIGPGKGGEAEETKHRNNRKAEETGKNFKPTHLSAHQKERR